MARVCAIRQFPYDTHLGREVDALVDGGHSIEVVCMRRPGEPWRERRGPLTIWRVPLEHRRAGAARYVFEHGGFVLLATALVALRHLRWRFDLVQVNSPPDSVVVAALAPRLCGVPLLLDLVECTPEFFATRFATRPAHPAVRLLERVEQLAIRFADGAITGTTQMRERFISRGADPHHITVVLNASDESVFSARSTTGEDRADKVFTLISHGSIERRYGLDTIVRAVALLRDRIPDLVLEIYGDGSDTLPLRRLADELGVSDRVAFNGFVAIDDLVSAIARADIGVVAVKRDAFRDLTHTNKMFDFVAMRRPVIASWTRSVADLFDDGALAFFRSDDAHDLARVIAELHGDPARRQRMIARASKLHERYRGRRQRDIYLNVVHQLTETRDS